MASKKTKSIEEIDDLFEMFQAMAALGIPCQGLKTLEEMKSRVKTELNQSLDGQSWVAGEVRTLLKLMQWSSGTKPMKCEQYAKLATFLLKKCALLYLPT